MQRRLEAATRVLQFILDNSVLLLLGAAAGLVWANVDVDSYTRFTHLIHFVINHVAMVFFFGLVAKEVYEATLPGGPLARPREAFMPILAAIGGMAAPAAIYAAFVVSLGRTDELMRGWAIPCATDIAFSYLVARLIFRRGTRRFRSCCCWPLPTTSSVSLSSRCFTRRATSVSGGLRVVSPRSWVP